MNDFLHRAAALVGPAHLLTDPADMAAFATDWRGRYHGRPLAVALPSSTDEVAALVALCRDAGVPVVPQGGNTGTVGAATPDDSGRELVIALRRLNRIRELDPDNATITVEAGCILADVHTAAAAAGLLFPLSLASEGSCQIGGNLAANAGGLAVLRYGTMRELTLGIEAVLPDGRVLHQLKGLRKNNVGLDAKQLLIGTEGTLGLITAATLKLYPLPEARATAMMAVASPAEATGWLRRLQRRFGDRLTTFELVSGLCLQLLARHLPEVRQPLAADWLVLFELSDGGSQAALDEALMEWLAAQADLGDAVLAQSERERAELWRVREELSEAQKRDGISLKHDIALPVSKVPAFLDECGRRLGQAFPGCRIVTFGHLGDGNLHYNVSYTRPDNRDLLADEAAVQDIVFGCACELGGTLSAEHGIGQLRRAALGRFHDPATLDLMRLVKSALDPHNLMNPGKLLP
ncbi:FAD-binding oxidoreductase [Laribacter hongkongensis]|uniref:FAD-binding oxidoreductase n=1 Tax=Laribacter hongkongensis TaxID=168471 RepID=UPI001EFC3616|nr:FAD-binding oxidoreductase [Laribacter hongkongensis]MCG9114551.1 FAD-binding oxidoreductase [Laribacter hongkongensis]